ncbi:MAG: hypothetical protein ACLFWB_14075 [Armatimonadota bacterium]
MKKPFTIAVIVVVFAAAVALRVLGRGDDSAFDRLELNGMVEATTIDVALFIAGAISLRRL